MKAQSNTTLSSSLLRGNGQRLWESLMSMARIGATPGGGNSRLALSAEDSAGRQQFIAACQALGMSVTSDAIGNLFCRYPGREPELLPVTMGSHLDTQPKGGRFDGIYGVLAALEVVTTLHQQQMTPRRTIEIIVWTNEEGARFTPAMMGSAVFTGKMTLDEALSRRDRANISVADALQQQGWRGDALAGRPFDAYFEAHIEQGPVLEEESLGIGIVTGGQAIRWLDITVCGQAAHAGTTPMKNRRDAMFACSEIISALETQAALFSPQGLMTIGELHISAASRNTIAGNVHFTLDIRHPDDRVLQIFDRQCREVMQRIADQRRTELDISEHWVSPAVPFDEQCVALVEQMTLQLGYPGRKMISGAGHDAINIAGHCPTAMIFIPCAGGISHNEAESITPEDAEYGLNVLLNSVWQRANR